jgi:hypothetical protein
MPKKYHSSEKGSRFPAHCANLEKSSDLILPGPLETDPELIIPIFDASFNLRESSGK